MPNGLAVNFNQWIWDSEVGQVATVRTTMLPLGGDDFIPEVPVEGANKTSEQTVRAEELLTEQKQQSSESIEPEPIEFTDDEIRYLKSVAALRASPPLS